MITQELKQKLQETKSKIGLIGSSIRVLEYDDCENNVTAYIKPNGWNISLGIKKGFEPVKDKRQKAYARRKNIGDGLEALLCDVLLHECAHWELPYLSEYGCPYDVYNHDKILEAVKQALPQDKKAHASYVTNAFEDLMINPRCKEFQGSFNGQVLFWDNEGLHAKQNEQKNYTPFYEAFVKLNMHLFGESADTSLLKRHYSDDKKVSSAVQKTISELKLPKDITKTPQRTKILFNRSRWPHMAGIFARNLAELLDTNPTERLSAFDSSGESDGQAKQDSGNGIEQKMGTPKGTEAIAFGRYSGKDRRSSNLTDYEQLDCLYRRLARDIPVRVEAMTRSQSLAITPLTFRPFDEEVDDIAKIKPSKIVLGKQEMTFAYPKVPLVIEARSKIQKRSFPDFKMVVLDNSGSMREGIDRNVGNTTFIPWGDNSKYHFALLGFYGIENFLQRQGIAQYINHGLSLFSSQTRYKESSYRSIDEVRKLALAPEFGDTFLDAGLLKEALKGRESFVLSISDGEIGNWDSERKDFKEVAQRNYYGHIQIGDTTSFTSDLESWRVPVFYVQSGKDLSKLMVDITNDTYRRFTRL